MSRVEFEESRYQVERNEIPAGIMGFLIRNGLVRNRRQAGYMLLILATACFLVSIFLINSLTTEEEIPEEKVFDPATAAPDVDQIHPNR